MNDTRRTFLGSSLGGALAAPAILSPQSPNDAIRVAFIGTGTRGSYLLEQVLLVAGIRVIAICDLDEAHAARAKAAVEKAGQAAPAVYSDFRKMLDERKDIDAVVIATPVDTHKMVSIAALEVGKHVYCEKPLAHTPEDAGLMAKAARTAKGIFQVGFQLRHDPNRRAAMEFIKSGGIGDVVFLQGFRHTGDLPRNRPWYFDRSRSGDNIVEQACHILDLMRWAAGSDPLRAYGSGGISVFKDVPPGRTTMDNYAVIYEFAKDIRLVFSHIYFDPPGFSGVQERVFGTKGAIDLASAAWSAVDKRGAIKLEVANPKENSAKLSLEAFFDNARGRKRPLNDIESGRNSTLMAMMGRKAIYEHRVVTWEEMMALAG